MFKVLLLEISRGGQGRVVFLLQLGCEEEEEEEEGYWKDGTTGSV